jgi:hypothetical protein
MQDLGYRAFRAALGLHFGYNPSTHVHNRNQHRVGRAATDRNRNLS